MAGKLREIAAKVDPALRVERFRFLDGVLGQQEANNSMVAYALAVVMGIVVLFSVAGIYTLMAFTVSQRRREIGIRSALGAQPSRLILGIFRSALGPVVTGAALGGLAAILLDFYLPIDQTGGRNVPGILPGAVAFMILVGLLALAGPAHRALNVDPTEALRDG
jgi:ABC-type antimicrobial peptide transport system permease subunit